MNYPKTDDKCSKNKASIKSSRKYCHVNKSLRDKESPSLCSTLIKFEIKETMLVANPGHTPYSFASSNNKISNSTNKTKIAATTSSSTTVNSISVTYNSKPSTSTAALTSSSSVLVKPSTSLKVDGSSSSIGGGGISIHSALAKPSTSSFDGIKNKSSKYNDVLNTLSIRLNRGTELIKQTVNKAFFSKIPPSFSGLLTVPPTSIHRSPDRNTKSTDSLISEMCHFKPIRSVPTTPNKKTKVIIRTPRPRRVQKPEFPRFVPLRSVFPLLTSSSQNSAFYLVKRAKELSANNTTITLTTLIKTKIQINESKSNSTKGGNSLSNSSDSMNSDQTTTSTIVTRLKRRRTESLSSSSKESNSKKMRLDDKSKQKKTKLVTNTKAGTNTSKNHNNNIDKPNGIFIENGQRRSIRIHNKKIRNDEKDQDSFVKNVKNNMNRNLRINNNSINKNKKNDIKRKVVEEKKNEKAIKASQKTTRKSQRNLKKNLSNGNIIDNDYSNHHNNNNDVNENGNGKKRTRTNQNKIDKNTSKIKSKSKSQKKQNPQQQTKVAASNKRKLSTDKNQSDFNSVECVHNLRPRKQKREINNV